MDISTMTLGDIKKVMLRGDWYYQDQKKEFKSKMFLRFMGSVVSSFCVMILVVLLFNFDEIAISASSEIWSLAFIFGWLSLIAGGSLFLSKGLSRHYKNMVIFEISWDEVLVKAFSGNFKGKMT